MKNLFLATSFFVLLSTNVPARAAALYTHTEVTALTSGIVNGTPWSDSQFLEIPTPSTGESQTATATGSFATALASGSGTTNSFLALHAQGFSGLLTQTSTAVPAEGGIVNFAVALNSGGAFVDFSISTPHVFSVVANGQIDGPTAPDDLNIDVQIQLMRDSGETPVDFLLEAEGAIALNQGGVLTAGNYSFRAVILNEFEFEATAAGIYNSSGNFDFAVTLTPIPEPSTLMISLLEIIGLYLAALRPPGQRRNGCRA